MNHDIFSNHHGEDNICPVCNGLITLEQSCPDCKEILEDSGQIENLMGPYAPYEEHGRLSEKKGNCIHQIVCPYCDKTWNVKVNKIDL